MAINLQREERADNFTKPKTPATIGPGTYNNLKSSLYGHEK